ncbi:IS1 family transposase [Dapis sp. BLCC M229]|uniref:IS1 family transposase n=1 Tax=Dapis sp. BLCC M229 TaxID=3400188 RepID=UPI003CF7688F
MPNWRGLCGLSKGSSGNRYQQSIQSCGVCYTDFWSADAEVLPSQPHQAVGKENGPRSYIERFNYTLHQRVSRLVPRTRSFSKRKENHIGAIWHFIHHHNASLPIACSFPF